jgi:hypothetical protein
MIIYIHGLGWVFGNAHTHDRLTLAGACAGKKIIGRISDRAFGVLVERGLLAAGSLFLAGR